MTPTPTTQDTQPTTPRQAEFQALLHEKMRLAIRLTLVDVLEDEVTAFIGAAALPTQSQSPRPAQWRLSP